MSRRSRSRAEGVGKRYTARPARRPGYSLLTEAIGAAACVGRRPKTREEFWALRDVDFEVAPGESFGIIGHNGAGKSTLLKILAAHHAADRRARSRLRGRVGALLEVGTGFHPELTGRENIFLNGAILGMRRSEITGKFDEIVEFAEVERFIDTPVKRYSSGMYAAARVRGRRPPRAGDPDRRRGAVGRRPRLPGEVPRPDGVGRRRGAHGALRQPQPGRDPRRSATARSCSPPAGSRPRAASARWWTPTSATSSRRPSEPRRAREPDRRRPAALHGPPPRARRRGDRHPGHRQGLRHRRRLRDRRRQARSPTSTSASRSRPRVTTSR